MSVRLEHFPNEILLDIFRYIDIRNLYRSFWGLNFRLNNLLYSMKNLSLITDQNDSHLIALTAHQILRLIVHTSNDINLSRFHNLHSLILHQATDAQMKQIRSESMPNLVRLSLNMTVGLSSPVELIQEIFTNKFPLLRHAFLGHFNDQSNSLWTSSESLRSIGFDCNDLKIVPILLRTCPNLNHFRLKILADNASIFHFNTFNHSLKEFFLFDPYHSLSPFQFMSLLSYMPNIERFYVQLWACSMTLMNLMQIIIDSLPNLKRFDCDITRWTQNIELVDLNLLQELQPCLKNIQYTEKMNGGLQIFLTE